MADLGDWRVHLLAPGRLVVTDVEVGKGSNGLVMEGVLDGTERVCCKVSEIGTGLLLPAQSWHLLSQRRHGPLPPASDSASGRASL